MYWFYRKGFYRSHILENKGIQRVNKNNNSFIQNKNMEKVGKRAADKNTNIYNIYTNYIMLYIIYTNIYNI